MRIIRVFPRRTSATPDDDLAVVARPPGWFDEADAVHVSVAFTWDFPAAEKLADQWRHVAPVSIGGPATGMAGGGFIPGMYLKNGYTITSRGCPNRCWFCSVWKREGVVRELPIRDGWMVQDDNLLACSDDHIRQVFEMLARQKEKPQFTGGLEAARLKPWHAEEMRKLHPKQLFFAYDTPDDLEPIHAAGKLLREVGFSGHTLRCYVLCGYPSDTEAKAEARMMQAVDAGFMPMAMAMCDESGNKKPEWKRFQRGWANPTIIGAKIRAA
jgi:hypothetical protein